jgi:hypothetical protein
MLKVGLIRRKKGRFSLTSLGIIAYHTQIQLECALNNYWNLKAIYSIQDLHTMKREERLKIIKKHGTDKNYTKSFRDPCRMFRNTVTVVLIYLIMA